MVFRGEAGVRLTPWLGAFGFAEDNVTTRQTKAGAGVRVTF